MNSCASCACLHHLAENLGFVEIGPVKFSVALRPLTETTGTTTIRDGKPRTATSTFTQLLSSLKIRPELVGDIDTLLVKEHCTELCRVGACGSVICFFVYWF